MLNLRSVHTWTRGTFVMDSGFYAGRGPTGSDLNSGILEMLYAGIKKDAGVVAAGNFVRFVNGLNDLSASAFIVAFERFAYRNCEVITVTQEKNDGIRVTGHGNARDAQAFAVIANVLGGPKRTAAELQREHESIKYPFIQNHQEEIPVEERRQTEFLSHYKK